MKTKLAKDLIVGDRIITTDGKPVTIKEVRRSPLRFDAGDGKTQGGVLLVGQGLDGLGIANDTEVEVAG